MTEIHKILIDGKEHDIKMSYQRDNFTMEFSLESKKVKVNPANADTFINVRECVENNDNVILVDQKGRFWGIKNGDKITGIPYEVVK